MKMFFKIALVVAAIAGVTYWLLNKCAWPAQRWKRYRHSRLQEADTPVQNEDGNG